MASDDIEIRSEEVQDILGTVPHWLIRGGVTCIFVILVLILVGSWFIRYPEVISANITLTTETPPYRVISHVSGPLELMVSDKEEVNQGQFLGGIQSAARIPDVLMLSAVVDMVGEKVRQNEPTGFFFDRLTDSLSLGGLEQEYSELLAAIEKKKQFIAADRSGQQSKALTVRIQHYHDLRGELENQLVLLRDQMELARRNEERDSILYVQNSESLDQWEASKAAFIQSQRNFGQGKTAITNNEIQISGLEQELAGYAMDEKESLRNLNSSIIASFKALQTKLISWKEQYLLKSGVEGIVTFTQYWKEGQFVNSGEEVLTIVPYSTSLTARATLPLNGSGKVKIGNRVIIRFNNYPEQEYGSVEGTVKTISLVPRESVYTLTVNLPSALISSYGKELEFRQEMQGTADIITADLRLMDRIFNNFRKLVRF